ncbi:MAG: hypothetical protein AB7O73_11170 [Bacteroidia bacterium]
MQKETKNQGFLFLILSELFFKLINGYLKAISSLRSELPLEFYAIPFVSFLYQDRKES